MVYLLAIVPMCARCNQQQRRLVDAMLNKVTRFLTHRNLSVLILENLMIVACVLAAARIRYYIAHYEFTEFGHPLPKAFIIAVVFQLFLHWTDVYDQTKSASFAALYARLAQSILGAAICFAVV